MISITIFQSEFAEEEDFAVKKDKEVAPTAIQPAEDVSPNPPPVAATMLVRTGVRNTDTPAVYNPPGKNYPYRTTFRTDFVTFNMDNNLLFEGLDSYAANPDGFNNQPLSLLLKANFKDLMEDYVIEGGMRLPTSFNGTEYFLTIQNRKRRLDRIFSAYRRNQRFPEAGIPAWARKQYCTGAIRHSLSLRCFPEFACHCYTTPRSGTVPLLRIPCTFRSTSTVQNPAGGYASGIRFRQYR
ncbi:MAG: hypothetical protein R2795_04415 [Saprospiraceae bacterium]